jgi:hypothetical protein
MLSFIRTRVQGLVVMAQSFANRTFYEEFAFGQWDGSVERDAPGFGFFNTRLEVSWMGGVEFWGFGLHVIAASERQYEEFRALRRMDFLPL